jgi:nucleotide-binding universal stress UspA family protein
LRSLPPCAQELRASRPQDPAGGRIRLARRLQFEVDMITRRILCAHDLTFASETALALALELARQLGVPLTVVHATEPPYTRATVLGADTFSANELELLTGIARRAEAAALRLLQEELAKVNLPGRDAVETDIVVRQGIPVDIVTRVARELEVDLVVVGTHARKGMEHALLGSVAERLIRTCPCPVLVARSILKGSW